MPDITYSRFQQVLQELGFRVDPARTAEDHTMYWRGEGTLSLLLPIYAPDDRVRPHHVDFVRSIFRHEDPDERDRYEVMIRTDPSTWAITGVAGPPATGPTGPRPATATGAAKVRRKPALRPKARKAPPAA
ncbi:MAG: hypothetical protein K2X82_04000 [Gemmataceae bacterium]|nr:hypothetical protein [Gemmataceae bacterium]